MIVVSLTSWTKRINSVKRVVESIMSNKVQPDKVYLNLSSTEFEGIDLPQDLVDYFNTDERLIINWVDGENTKTMKKVFPVLKYLNDDDIIIDGDDDILFPKDLIESRLKDFNNNGGKYPITSNTHTSVGFNGQMKVASAMSLYQKRMLKNYEAILTDKIIKTYNDDRTYLHLCWMNGYKNKPCSKYNIFDLLSSNYNLHLDYNSTTNTNKKLSVTGRPYDDIFLKEFKSIFGQDKQETFGCLKDYMSKQIITHLDTIQVKKLVVYFYLTNNVNHRPWPEITYLDKDIDYYMFTDDYDHIPDKNWNVVYIDAENDVYSKEDMNKKIKWSAFEHFAGKYEYALYCDSKIAIVSNPLNCVNDFKDKLKVGFTCHKYGFIKNSKYIDNVKDVYRHADYLLDVKVGHLENIKKLKETYKKEGLPLNSGVVETAVILTDLKNETARKIQDEILTEYLKMNTKRDQLIVPYVLWKNNIKCEDIELLGNFEDNKKHAKYFQYSSNTNVNNRNYSSSKYHNSQKIVVSMTSWKKRISNCERIVVDIESGTLVPDKIYLNLSVEEFPDKERELPEGLVNLVNKYNNFIINWVDGPNTKSIKKIFPILKYLDDNDIIIDTDDDIILPKGFIESRVNDYYKYLSPITGGTTKHCKGVVFHEVCGLDYMKTATACSLYTKKMLNGYELILKDDIIKYFNDDIMYSALIYLNGYYFKPCSDYSVWADKDWTKNKLKFFNEINALSDQPDVKKNYYNNSKMVVSNIKETIKDIKNNPFDKKRYNSFIQTSTTGSSYIQSLRKDISEGRVVRVVTLNGPVWQKVK
jgi:hypothetical protein